MPIPLLPFAIKGAFVIGKMVLAKAAVAKAGAMTISAMIKAHGVAYAVAQMATACIIIGGLHWSVERIQMLEEAVTEYKNGNNTRSAKMLLNTINSFDITSRDDFLDLGRAWISDGAPLDGRFTKLAGDAKSLLDEIERTIQQKEF